MIKTCVMKRLILILLLIPSLGFSQTVVNNDSLLYHFKKIINNYRKSYGLSPLEVDGVLKSFTDDWSKQMAATKLVGHGGGDNVFQKRILDCNCFPPATFCAENCTDIYTPVVNFESKINCPIRDLIPYIEKSVSGNITQYELAYYIFLSWKNSPPHNQTMLSKDTKYFYVSGAKRGDFTYLCYVARS